MRLAIRAEELGFDSVSASDHIQRQLCNWLQVLGATELAQIDQRVRHQFHAIVPLLDTFKS